MFSLIHSVAKQVLFLLLVLTCVKIEAAQVELKGKITLLSGHMPAAAILRSTADESYSGTAIIDKDGNFSFTAAVSKAGLFNLRVMRLNYDVILSEAEKTTNIAITYDGDVLKDIGTVNSKENDAYKAFETIIKLYDIKVISHFRFCENEDSCEKALHELLAEYAHELSIVEKNFKGTYTAEVLCPMKMPAISKNVKGTSDEYRAHFFDRVDFSDSTIFATTVYKDMIGEYVDYIIEPSLTKEDEFVDYLTEHIKSNPVVLHKSSTVFLDELIRGGREKMLAIYIKWYNTDDHKAAVNNPVLDVRIKNISHVMPGQPYIDISAPDSSGTVRTLKEVVNRSKCTMLLFWSSECPHCRDEMPQVKEYYNKYNSQGLDVYAVSLEQDPEKWQKFVYEKQLPWTNVISGYKSDPNPAMEYVTVSTPTMVLIDSKGIIIHRFVSKNKLEKDIIEALK
jgi:peroxiredoxin